jgi:hypothetical protein
MTRILTHYPFLWGLNFRKCSQNIETSIEASKPSSEFSLLVPNNLWNFQRQQTDARQIKQQAQGTGLNILGPSSCRS